MTTNAKLAEDVVRVRDANRLPDGCLQFRGVVGRTNPRLDQRGNRTESLADNVEQVFLSCCDQTHVLSFFSAFLQALYSAFLQDRLIRR